MSATCSVVVTLSRVSRPCRSQCCSRQGPKGCHANASGCVLFQPRSHGVSQLFQKLTSPQEHPCTNHCSSLSVSAFDTNLPRTLLPASRDHQQLTSSFRQGRPTIRHTSQPFPSTAPGVEPVPSARLAFLGCGARLSSFVSCGPWLVRNSPLPETLPRRAGRNDVS